MNFSQPISNLLKILFRSDRVEVVVHDTSKKEIFKLGFAWQHVDGARTLPNLHYPRCANIYQIPETQQIQRKHFRYISIFGTFCLIVTFKY